MAVDVSVFLLMFYAIIKVNYNDAANSRAGSQSKLASEEPSANSIHHFFKTHCKIVLLNPNSNSYLTLIIKGDSLTRKYAITMVVWV